MPVLPLEPFVFPADLFRGPTAPGPARWWVLHTRPRGEKSLARKFLDRNLSFFLPLCKRHRRRPDRVLVSHLPLFPGYVFLFGDPQARLDALTTNLVLNCLPVPDQEQLFADLNRV